MSSQGKQAVVNGAGFKKALLATLQNRGFEVVPYKEFFEHPEWFLGKNVVLTGKPYINSYNKVSRTGYVIKPVGHPEYRVEGIWQQVSGTANHKVSFKMDSYPENDVVMVYGGGVFDSDTISGMRQLAANRSKNNIIVMSHDDYVTWVNNTF